MSAAIIGLESMPNVYFNSVGISDNKLQILLTMKDDDNNPTWYKSQILRDILKIKVIALSYNTGPAGAVPTNDIEMKRIADGLKDGSTSIHDFTYPPQMIERAAQLYNQDRTFISDDGLVSLYYNVEFTSADLNLDKQNVFVFALAYIDVTAMNLNYASYKYLDGPMASETVRKNNQTPQNATLFKLEDGSIWSGPVHQSEIGYMEGSFHKMELHSELTTEFVDAKITQFIEDIMSENIMSGIEEINTPDFDASILGDPTTGQIGDKFFHYENDDDISIFVVDSIRLALNELKSARELYNANNEYFYELMQGFVINQFELRKAPLKTRLDFVDIGSRDWAYDDTSETVLARTIMTDGMFEERYEMRFFSRQYNVDPNKLVEATTNQFDINTKSTFDASKKIGYIKPLPSNEQFLHNLLIVDEQYGSEEATDYKLKISLDIIDNFRETLVQTRNEINSVITELNVIYNGLFGKIDQERIINFFSQSGIFINNNLKFVSISSQDLFDNSIFSKTKKVIKNALLALISDNEMISGISNRMVSSLYINSSSKENFNNVAKFLTNLSNKLTSKYNLGEVNGDSKISKSGVIRVEKIIQKVIQSNNYRDGSFNYFNKPQDKRIVTTQDIINRGNQEFNKFFTRELASGEIMAISKDIGEDSAQQMVTFDKVKYAFFTPTSYDTADQSIDLSQADISIFDEKKHDLITNHMFKVKNQAKARRRGGLAKSRKKLGRQSKLGKPKLLSTIGISKPFKKSAAAGDDSKFEDAKEYLGSTSLFLDVNLGTRRKNIEPSKGPPNLIRKSFAQNRKIRKFQNISLNDETSYLIKNKNKIDFSKLPLQFRALVLSNYNLSRFSFPLEEQQLIENPRFSTALNNIFNRIKFAQYIDGFERDQRGLRKLSSPIYRPLTLEALQSGKTLMIKMSNFKSEFLQMEEEDQIPSKNTFFAVEGTIQPASNPIEPDPLHTPLDWEIKEFSTTNIVNQNEKRKELIKFVKNEPLQQASSRNRTNNTRPAETIRPTRRGY